MKIRIISSLLGLVIYFTIMTFLDSLVMECVIAVVASMATYELIVAIKANINKFVTISLMTLSNVLFASYILVNRFGVPLDIQPYTAIVPLISIATLLCIVLKYHQELRLEKLMSGYLISQLIPMSFFSLIRIRDMFVDTENPVQGIYYVIMIFAFAWGSDTGGYFAGRFLGKRKLSPIISPNKTVEGVYGGVVVSYIFALIVTLGMHLLFGIKMPDMLALLCVCTMCSLIGVAGDLTASVIKRQNDVKDFGKIMPGHGGVMDRFDSVVMIAPVFSFLVPILDMTS